MANDPKMIQVYVLSNKEYKILGIQTNVEHICQARMKFLFGQSVHEGKKLLLRLSVYEKKSKRNLLIFTNFKYFHVMEIKNIYLHSYFCKN